MGVLECGAVPCHIVPLQPYKPVATTQVPRPMLLVPIDKLSSPRCPVPCLLLPAACHMTTAATPAKIQLTPSTPDEENVVVGKATVYTGPFTVHSSGPLKYQRGYFQFSFFSNDDGTPVPANTVSTLPRFGDETYKFEFIDERPLPGRY